ncbi:MAG: nucleoside hydrolase [Bacteroidota bacterium]
MKINPINHSFFYLFILILFSFNSSCAQPQLIFDTDFGGDFDDLGALAMLHHFVDNNECELLSVMCWNTERYAVSAIDAVNRYYGHPDIPIGVRKDGAQVTEWNYTKPLADAFPYQLNYENAEDAIQLYRKILSASKDKTIVVVTVGPLKNIQGLIESKPDQFSALTGKELIQKKVKEFVIMGGRFPEGKNEWNFNGDMPGVTKFVIENINAPIVFSGYEVGLNIKTGEVFNELNKNHPLYIGAMHFSENAPWIKENFAGKILDNSTYDQTAVLYAVRNGEGVYWNKITGGYCEADDTGGNKWNTEKTSNHAYLKLIRNNEEMAQMIEKMMLGNFK